MAIGTERNAIIHQGAESFDGELARLLIYGTALDQQKMEEVYDYVRTVYFEKRTSINESLESRSH